ncbi:MAG: hypothetical protein ACTSXQ_04445 [Alphaproteobacteria bacterium]
MNISIENTKNSPFVLMKIDGEEYPLLVTKNHLSGKTSSFPRIGNPTQKLHNFSARVSQKVNFVQGQMAGVTQNAEASLRSVGDTRLDLPQSVGENILATHMTGMGVGTAAGLTSLALTSKNLYKLEPALAGLLESAKALYESDSFLDGVFAVIGGVDDAVILEEGVTSAFNNPFLDFVGRQSPWLLGAVVLGGLQAKQYIKEQRKNKKYNPFVKIAQEAERLSKNNTINDEDKLKQLQNFTNTIKAGHTEKREKLMSAFSTDGMPTTKKGMNALAENYKHLSMGQFSTKTSPAATITKAKIIKDEIGTPYVYIETKGGGHFLTSVEDVKNGKLFNIQEKEKSATRSIRNRKKFLIVQGIVLGTVLGGTALATGFANAEIIKPVLQMVDGLVGDLGMLGNAAVGLVKDVVGEAALAKVAAAMPSPFGAALSVAVFQMRRPIVKAVVNLYRTIREPRRLLEWAVENKKDMNRARSQTLMDKVMHMVFPARARKAYRKNAASLIQAAKSGEIRAAAYQDFTETTFAKTTGKTRMQRVREYAKNARLLLKSHNPEKQALNINTARLIAYVNAADLKGNKGSVMELIPELLKMGIPPEVLEKQLDEAKTIEGFKTLLPSNINTLSK